MISSAAERTIIVYGNCQAEAVVALMNRYSGLAGRYRVLYLRSFEHPTEGWQQLSPEEIARCAVLLEQHDPRAFPYVEALPEDCSRLKFPAVDFNLLWPFNRVNPYNEPETPELPFGSFPYGDRMIVDAIERGVPGPQVLADYLEQWDEYNLDLDRLLALEDARLLARDARCDIKLGAYVLTTFRSIRLFWTVNHPTMDLLLEVTAQLLNGAFPNAPRVSRSILGKELVPVFGERGPLGAISVPIHPRVAEHFGLTWYDPRERFRAFDGTQYTYEEYFRAMIDLSLSRKLSNVS